MNLLDIQKIPLKEKKFLIGEVCLMYNKLKAVNELSTQKTHEVNDRLKKVSLINERTISMFDTIISLLHEDQAEIIVNEFVLGRKSSWENARWSKTTYYNIKNQAIDQFIYLLFA